MPRKIGLKYNLSKSFKLSARIFSFLLIFLIFFLLSKIISFEEVYLALLNADLKLIPLLIVISFFYPLIGSFRWKSVLVCFEKSLSFKEALKSVMISYSANLIAPAKTGDFAKAFVTEINLSKGVLTSAVISERLIDLLSLLLLSALFSFFLSENMYFVFCSLSFLFINFFVFLVNKNVNFFSRFASNVLLKFFFDIFLIWRTRRLNLIRVFSYSLGNWILGGFQVWLLFIMLNVEINLFSVLSLYPICVLISLIPLTPASIGLRESAFIFIFLQYSSPDISILVSLLYFFFTVVVNGLLGIFFTYLFINKSLK